MTSKRPFLPTLIGSVMAAGAGIGAEVSQDLEIIGRPIDGAYGFQPAVTEIAQDILWLDNLLLWIIGVICIFVLGLLAIVVFRYNESRNPKPAGFTHNTPIEIIWTLVPIVILVGIGAISLPVLFKQQIIPEADVTIKASGNQWYWTYEYPEHGIEFDSFMLARDQLEEYGYSQDEYLLATDTAIVIPVDKTVVVHVTGTDVIHAWTIPAFGVKQDAVPGRLAGLWFKAEKEGIYFGQCSELCGKDHSYMPITVKVVSQAAYEKWLDDAIEEYATLAPLVPPVADDA